MSAKAKRKNNKKPYDRKNRKYNEEWEKEAQFKGWLKPTSEELIAKGKGEAFCKLCDQTIRAHKDGLKDHASSEKHKKAERGLVKDRQGRQQPTVLQAFAGANDEKNKMKINDLKLACFVASHTSTKPIDHLGELLRDLGQGSRLANLKLHRTKCSKLIMKVLAPPMLEEIIKDVGQSSFSVIVDESTDLTTKKYMAILKRYYSYSKSKMMTEFLGLVQLVRQTADALFQGFSEFMLDVGLDLRRLLALGCDGAAALCGRNHSLFTLLRDNYAPKLQLMQCLCHSMDKCASYASKELPSSLEFMLRETTSWFSHSAIRKNTYEEIYKELNAGKEPSMLVKLSVTRWLARGNAVARVLDQYNDLKALFVKEASNEDDKCYTAKTLNAMYQDRTNELYLTFLRPVLREVNRYNLLFQSTNADITKAYKDLRIFVFSLARRVLKREAIPETNSDGILRGVELSALNGALKEPGAYVPLDRVQYGESFQDLAKALALPAPVMTGIQQRCANFLVRLTKELVSRLPSCVEVVERLRFFAADRVLAKRARPAFRQLPLDLLSESTNKEALEAQWASIGELSLADIMPEATDAQDVDVVEFWGTAWRMKNAAGVQPYRELAEYVITLLSLPLSNAVVERIFSVMAIVKSKLRNRLSHKMLEAILRIRAHLGALGVCCKSFTVTPAMLEMFKSDILYEKRPVAAVGNASRRGGEAEAEHDEALIDEPMAMQEDDEENEEVQMMTIEAFGDLDVVEIEIY